MIIRRASSALLAAFLAVFTYAGTALGQSSRVAWSLLGQEKTIQAGIQAFQQLPAQDFERLRIQETQDIQ